MTGQEPTPTFCGQARPIDWTAGTRHVDALRLLSSEFPEGVEEALVDGAAFQGLGVGSCRNVGEESMVSVKAPSIQAAGVGSMDDEAVIAATRQWIEKAVIGLNLCPFAKAVYGKGQVRFVVSRAKHLDGLLEDLDRELDILAAADPEAVETTLLIHPTLPPDFLDFNDFMQLAEAAVEEHDLQGVIQIASFHPTFQFAGTEPDDIGNFTNRAPFPTLHLLREASIERAIAAFPEAETIYKRNIETLKALGHAGWQALWRKP